MATEKKTTPAYLGNCDEFDCGHFRWCGDSYWDRNTECYCLVNSKSVYRHEADEERIECPLGYAYEEDDDE
jgi:hypothetical protein